MWSRVLNGMTNPNREKIVIDKLLEFYNKENNTNYKVVDKPEPPDAIASDGEVSIWIEHCDVYRSDDEAKEDNHKDCKHIGPLANPDEGITQKFLINLENKLTKESYIKAYNEFGQGILVMVIRDPLFDAETLERIKEVSKDVKDLIENNNYFKEVYVTWNNKYLDCIFQKII